MDTDLIKLYSTRILALAADIPNLGRLSNPMSTVKRRSPLCGSMVIVDLDVVDGVVTRFGQDVKACALGQAAASVVGASIIGSQMTEVTKGRDELRAMLAGGATPSAPFEGFESLRPSVEFKNRHASILLAIEASVDAIEHAQSQSCA